LSFRVAFQTFGCKLNQLETESLADEFKRKGASLVSLADEADLYIFNTCTVTSKAEQKARRLIRSALAAHPGAWALVTGCYAQMEPEALAALSPEGRLVVVPGENKADLLGLADSLSEIPGPDGLDACIAAWRDSSENRNRYGKFSFEPESFSFHSRPSLKIEDGCDNRCAYCRVCLARGKAVSLEAPEVLKRLKALEDAGAAEAVLTGVNLSQYRSGSLDFAGLLGYLLDNTSHIALRLSSYEPDRFDPRLMDVFSEQRVRPHMHFAIQSGSDSVLARMGRRYRRDDVLAACGALRQARRDPFIACDLIVGFPGETDEEFEDSAALAREVGFAWIHAFQFSPRPGTRAYSMKPQVPERVAGGRAAVLAELAAAGREAYIARWLGSEVSAVLERGSTGSCPDRAGRVLSRATSENYLKLLVSLPAGSDTRPGREVSCRLRMPADKNSAVFAGTASVLPAAPALPPGVDAFADSSL